MIRYNDIMDFELLGVEDFVASNVIRTRWCERINIVYLKPGNKKIVSKVLIVKKSSYHPWFSCSQCILDSLIHQDV